MRFRHCAGLSLPIAGRSERVFVEYEWCNAIQKGGIPACLPQVGKAI